MNNPHYEEVLPHFGTVAPEDTEKMLKALQEMRNGQVMVMPETIISLHLPGVQKWVGDWQKQNFPSTNATEQLLGVGEEVGELMHYHLKGIQGIRHTPEEVIAKKKDVVGDICVYLMNYCTHEDLDFEECIQVAWNELRKRDWVADPMGGVGATEHKG